MLHFRFTREIGIKRRPRRLVWESGYKIYDLIIQAKVHYLTERA